MTPWINKPVPFNIGQGAAGAGATPSGSWATTTWDNDDYTGGTSGIYVSGGGYTTYATGARVVAGGELDGFALKKVEMTFYKAGSPTVTVYCRVYADEGGAGLGTLRGQATETYASGDKSTGDILEFNFSSAIVLAEADIIAIYADNSGCSATSCMINCANKTITPPADSSDIVNYRWRSPTLGWTDVDVYNPSARYST